MENLEYIFPQDLKMWAKSAGRKFLEAQDKIKALSTKNISASAYWDENSNVAILTEEGKIRRGVGNQQLGREIFRAWKREQNAMQGRPSDEYTEQGVVGDQFETIGTLAKEMYHAANPELYTRVSDSFNRTVEYELTPTGAAAIQAAEDSSPD